MFCNGKVYHVPKPKKWGNFNKMGVQKLNQCINEVFLNATTGTSP